MPIIIANMATGRRYVQKKAYPDPKPTRIGAGRRPHLYIAEHMAAKDRSNSYIAKRLEINRSTVGKWLDKGDAISIEELHKLAFALDLEDWREFLRPPGQESVDVLIEDVPPTTREAIVDFAKKMGRG